MVDNFIIVDKKIIKIGKSVAITLPLHKYKPIWSRDNLGDYVRVRYNTTDGKITIEKK